MTPARMNQGKARRKSARCHQANAVAPAMTRPEIAPRIPIAAASIEAKRSTCKRDAPRMRNKACSRRRRSDPEIATASVANSARTMPGTPRNKNSTRA
jgi:hypothetical protein